MKAASLLLLATALPASAETVAPLTWTTCSVPAASSPDIAERTECAHLVVPRDYANPAAGMLNLDVVRVVSDSERGARHDGALLLEPDEFSDDIGHAVPSMASAWREGGEGWREVARPSASVLVPPMSHLR